MHLSEKEVPVDRENLLRFCSWREGLKRLWSIKRCAGLILLTQESCWDGVTTSIEHKTCTAGDPLREGTKEGGIKCRHRKYFSMIYYWEIPGQHATVVFKVIFSMLEFFETWKAGQGATCRSPLPPLLYVVPHGFRIFYSQPPPLNYHAQVPFTCHIKFGRYDSVKPCQNDSNRSPCVFCQNQ